MQMFDWRPRFPVCVMFGHETDGLTANAAEMADTHIRIPMLGRKHSLNVASAGSVILYELLRKYRKLLITCATSFCWRMLISSNGSRSRWHSRATRR